MRFNSSTAPVDGNRMATQLHGGSGDCILAICPTARDRAHFARPEIQDHYHLELRGTDEATHAPGFDGAQFLTDTLREIRARPGTFQAVFGIYDFPAFRL